MASYNLGDRENARTYAERVADDEHFGKRAREPLDRLSRRGSGPWPLFCPSAELRLHR